MLDHCAFHHDKPALLRDGPAYSPPGTNPSWPTLLSRLPRFLAFSMGYIRTLRYPGLQLRPAAGGPPRAAMALGAAGDCSGGRWPATKLRRVGSALPRLMRRSAAAPHPRHAGRYLRQRMRQLHSSPSWRLSSPPSPPRALTDPCRHTHVPWSRALAVCTFV
jgi:hypothetical protein